MATIRVRARAVDMLGRQQIAGIPTAIHELFKNAHDAYADHVEVDLFRKDQMLIIRDDGYGMTRHDFEQRWLTLGTESKIGSDRPDRNSVFADRPRPEPRPIMGEKGIGRLAIAAIGPMVFVMTRSTRCDGLGPLVASLIHWGLFELPGIDLDRIQIPIEEIPAGDLPTKQILQKLADQIKVNIASLGHDVPDTDRERFLADLQLATFDPQEIDSRLTGLTLRDEGYGTHFYIRPVNPVLIDDIEGGTEDNASPLERMLLGFSNTMLPDRPAPNIIGEFRDRRADGTIDELIGERAFFTPDEFISADHHIEGAFDDYGQFQGIIAVYRGEPRPHTISWPKAAGKPTECGPFRIKFAYVQGSWKDSRLPQDQWASLSAKLDRIGGLYVYRDGIRILPYGNSDYDFLNIERRRTKSASDWFFSYRRLFGAVEITQNSNSNLVEKAGREGFRENLAYRQFTAILENFFTRLALDFFRETSPFGDLFNEYREQLNRERELLKKRERSTRVRRKEFTERLNGFFEDLEMGRPAAEAAEIRNLVGKRLDGIAEIREPDAVANALIGIEQVARERIRVLEEATTITRPRSIGLSKSLKADWNAYMKNVDKIRREVLDPLAQEIDGMITSVATSRKAGLDRRRRVVIALDLKRKAVTNETARLRRDVEQALSELSKEAEDAIRFSLNRVTSDLEQIFVDIERTDLSKIPDAESRVLQRKWEGRIDTVARETRELLESLRDQFTSVAKAVRDRESLEETTAAIESAAEQYRDELESYVELAQIGMALGIVQHEFGVAVRNIRAAIRKLKPWADGTPDLRTLYKDLRIEFDHLDGYLKLFTPLSRRLHRQAVELSGEEIRRYLDEVFHNRLDRHAIKLLATPLFDRMKAHCYPSTYLPAFVNIIDNAIYWITTEKDSERLIRLDSDGKSFTIWNGGPGIDGRIADRIFDFGETSKPSGRGIGLYLAREGLRREGAELSLDASGSGEHPCFRITPPQNPTAPEEKK